MASGPTRPLSWSVCALIALLGSALVLFLWAFWWEPGRLVTRHAQLRLPGWGAEPPLRAVVIADLHVGSPRNGIEHLRRLVKRTNGAEPDVVFLLGDYVITNVFGGQFVAPEDIVRELAAMKAPLGVYAVLGNHDTWLSASRVEEAFARAGITVLENRAVRVGGAGRRAWIAGVSNLGTGTPDIAGALDGVTDDGPVILMTHNPDLFPEVPARVSLTVAGHTHGGQVILPLFGRAITPSRFGERYAAGHVVELGRHLFVTTGVGTSRLGVRFRVPPEIVVLDLGPCDACEPPLAREPRAEAR